MSNRGIPDYETILAPGNTVVIRTVTFSYCGIVAHPDLAGFVELTQASWLAEIKPRFGEALKKFADDSEIEVIPGEGRAAINRSGIIDVTLYLGKLPRKSTP